MKAVVFDVGDVLLRELRPRHRTAICSNAWSGARAAFEGRFGFHRDVDAMVISAEVGLAKPDPAIFHLVLDRLDVAAADALFVDDREDNVAAARALGMHALRCVTSAETIASARELLGLS